MKKLQTLLATVALLAIGAMFVPTAKAQSTESKRTILTFDQSFEVPGKVLPAGTYTFRLMDSKTNRHIVQIYSADGTQLIWTCLAINNARLKATDKTVMTFGEATGDTPQPIKAWFYPGETYGQEFVYPKQRAIEIAATVYEPVQAIPDNVPVEMIATAPVEVVTPPPAPVAASAPRAARVIEPAPVAQAAPVEMAANVAPMLPKTASLTPLFGLLGLFSLGLAVAVRRLATGRA